MPCIDNLRPQSKRVQIELHHTISTWNDEKCYVRRSLNQFTICLFLKLCMFRWYDVTAISIDHSFKVELANRPVSNSSPWCQNNQGRLTGLGFQLGSYESLDDDIFNAGHQHHVVYTCTNFRHEVKTPSVQNRLLRFEEFGISMCQFKDVLWSRHSLLRLKYSSKNVRSVICSQSETNLALRDFAAKLNINISCIYIYTYCLIWHASCCKSLCN